jgi:hypothetical protein
MDFFLSLLDQQNRLNSRFIKANRFLINKHISLFEKFDSDTEKNQLLEKLWNLENKGTLVRDENSSFKYQGIKFEDQNSLTLFLLKYG